jgi:hypothetical protein
MSSIIQNNQNNEIKHFETSVLTDISHKYKTARITAPLTIDKEQIKYSDQSISNEFICSICKSIPLDPIKCSKCNIIFCRQEFNSWVQSHRTCPMKCSSSSTVNSNLGLPWNSNPPISSTASASNLSHTERNILNQLGINCKCGTEGLTFETIKAHYATCDIHAEYICLECNTTKTTIEAIEKHVIQDCPLLYTTCIYCSISLRKNLKETHQAECRQMCKTCNTLVPKLKTNEHKLNECAGIVKQYYEKLLTEEKEQQCQKMKAYIEENEKLKQENKFFNDYVNKTQNDFESLKKRFHEMNELVDANIKVKGNNIVQKYNQIRGTEVDGFRRKQFWLTCLLYVSVVVILCLAYLYYKGMNTQNNSKQLNN